MHETRSITRLLSLLLTAALLLLAGAGSSWTAVAKGPVKAATEQTDHPQDVVVKAASLEAVVTSATTFDFSHVAYLLPPPSLVLITAAQPLTHWPAAVAYFYFSYFRYVFGHAIAPNAP